MYLKIGELADGEGDKRDGRSDIMRRQRTFQEYRAIDLSILAVMMAVFEFIIVMAANWWFPDQLYTVSLAAALTSIVYMRWGFWGLIHAVEAGLIFCFFSGATREQYIIYCIGNLFSAGAVFLLRAVGKEKVRTSPTLSLVFPILVLFLMQAGRAVTAMVVTGAAPGVVAGFFATDSLSYIFTFVIIWIARKLDGVYEDQKHYLLRLHAREE